MAKRSSKDAIVNKLDALLADMPPADILVLAGGFLAGTMGYTPLSAILGAAGKGDISGNTEIRKAREAIKGKLTEQEMNQANNYLNQLDFMAAFGSMFGNPVPGFAASWAASGVDMMADQKAPLTQEQLERQKDTREYIKLSLVMGITGMIEAYVITRPGTIAGIGEIVKGIGEIVPG